MGMCYINQTIEIPIQGSSRAIGFKPDVTGDLARTAGGTLRYDVSTDAVKRGWDIQAELLTQVQFEAIYNYLKSINFGFTYFWLDSFGGTAALNSITARILIVSAPREKVPGIYYGLSLSATEQ